MASHDALAGGLLGGLGEVVLDPLDAARVGGERVVGRDHVGLGLRELGLVLGARLVDRRVAVGDAGDEVEQLAGGDAPGKGVDVAQLRFLGVHGASSRSALPRTTPRTSLQSKRTVSVSSSCASTRMSPT